MEQRTDDWFQARCGVATASRFADILAKIKKGESASRRNYRAQLAVERLSSAPQSGFTSEAMRWGTEQETFAKVAYIAKTGHLIDEVGFIKHSTLQAGASPDGLISDDGLIEIKCPFQSAVHIETLKSKTIPAEHIPQVQGQMWITGRKWVDFVSYDPRMPEPLQLFIYRVERDDDFITELEVEIRLFLSELDAEINELLNLIQEAA